MLKSLLTIGALLFLPLTLAAEEPSQDAAPVDEVADETEAETMASNTPNGDGIKSPKAMSGMSILGNEEAPKALVIVPWKSSELGETISLSDTLDDRARAVDKEVFMRELRFYEIRSED